MGRQTDSSRTVIAEHFSGTCCADVLHDPVEPWAAVLPRAVACAALATSIHIASTTSLMRPRTASARPDSPALPPVRLSASSRDLSTPICPVARYPSFFMFELCRFAQVCTICFPAMLTKKLCSETPRSCTTRWRGWVPMRCVQAADASARHTQNDILGLSALRIDTSLHACSRLRCARPI